MSGSALVKELQLLDEIEKIAEEYELLHGVAPTNLSIWDPSEDVVSTDLYETLPPISSSGKNYIFSYILQDNHGIRSALGYRNNQWRSLVSHSGSSSIVMTCNWLRSNGARKILIVGPRYFTVPHCLSAMGLEFDTVHCKRSTDGYSLPIDLQA